MVKIDFRTKRTQINSRGNSQIVRNFSGLQKTQIEADKQSFADMALVENMIHKGANSVLRNGMQKLKQVPDLLGVVIHETPTENYLYAYAKDGSTTSKLVEVDRVSGDLTDKVTGIPGQGAPSYCSRNGYFYLANGGTQITEYDRSSDTALGVSSGVTYKYVNTDGSRIWFVKNDGDEDLLGFSRKSVLGAVSSLTGGGTALLRAGISESSIINFTSLSASGEVIMASSADKIEFFRIPDFSRNGVTTFEDDVPLRIDGATITNLGIESQNNLLVVGGTAYVVSRDSVLYAIPVGSNNYKVLRDNQLQMDDFQYDQVAMGYDHQKNLLLISCRNGSANDRIVCYNILENNFSLFTNVFASQFTNDADNLYYVGRSNYVIEALKDGTYSDDGIPIQAKVRTQINDFGTLERYKVVTKLFYNVEYNENLTVTNAIYVDRGINGAFSPSYTKQVPLIQNSDNYLSSPQIFGNGLLGACAFDTEDYPTEVLSTSERVNLSGVRFEAELTASSSSRFSIRGIGLTAQQTSRESNTITYTN